MKSLKTETMEKALRASWHQPRTPQTLTRETRDAILAQIQAREPRQTDTDHFFAISKPVRQLAWAASLAAVVSGWYGFKILTELSLTTTYVVSLF